jgi:hypothetical protein
MKKLTQQTHAMPLEGYATEVALLGIVSLGNDIGLGHGLGSREFRTNGLCAWASECPVFPRTLIAKIIHKMVSSAPLDPHYCAGFLSSSVLFSVIHITANRIVNLHTSVLRSESGPIFCLKPIC